ncbi:TlpA disulfide reductase family protein [Algibacter sp. 2305UL17-15]|uniref:TlpA family protein disulfide reductase n=1 Tax=Algibacter sp. 2305UL17-15 TaxID=3231268 RepID=UPI00345885B9
MKTLYYLIVLTVLVFSCNNTDKNKDDTNSISKEVQAIEKTGFLTVISKTDIKSPFLISKEKNFNNLQNYQHFLYDKYDTLKIKIQPYQLIEVRNKYHYPDTLIVKQGDTLVLSYVNDSLVKEIHNKSKYQAKRFSYKSIADTTFLNYLDAFVSKYFVIDYTNPLELVNDYSKNRVYHAKANQDIIKNDNEISKLVTTYDSLFIEYKAILDNRYNDSRKGIFQDFFLRKRFYDIFMVYKLSKNPKLKDYMLSEDFVNSLKPSPNQYSMLSTILFQILYKDKEDRSRSKVFYNIPEIYNDLPNKFTDTTLLKKAKIICLEEMVILGNPLKEVAQLFEKFNLEYSDSSFQNYFETKHLIGLKKKYNSTTELNLLDSNGAIKSFNDLKNSLKGNVIYVDFWASWCAPCRKAMPASKELLNEFYGKENIVFIYISLDKNNEAWKSASLVEGIDSYVHNYLILNPDQSKFMHDLKIREIPRYMIFDANGKLVEDNAPGPTSKKIKETLLKYKVK